MNRALPLSVLVACLAISASACNSSLCLQELSEGATYSATVVGPYGAGTAFPGDPPFSPGERPTCEGFDGLVTGARVTIRATETVKGSGCDELRGPIIEAPSGVVIEKPGSVGFGGRFLAGASVATIAGCKGLWTAGMVKNHAPGEPFAEPVPGQSPPVLLLRIFSPEMEGPACRACQDFLTVRFQKL